MSTSTGAAAAAAPPRHMRASASARPTAAATAHSSSSSRGATPRHPWRQVQVQVQVQGPPGCRPASSTVLRRRGGITPRATPRPPAVAAAAAAAAASAAPPEQLNGQQQEQQPGGGEAFNWLKAWYPVAIVSSLDPAKPTPSLLLGRPLVLWRNPKTNNWCAFEDRCPHRLAPLSEGRLDPASGDLMCSYHGWKFDAAGRCTAIPQIADPAALATALSSKRTCVAAYPCREAQGLLWVWPDAGSADEAAASAPALTEHWGSPDWTLLGGEWFSRDLEYGFDTLMENLFDPSHIPFAHHKIMGPATRDKVQPLEVHTTQDITPKGGFRLARDTAPFRTPDPTDTVNIWQPPCLNCSIQTNTRTGRTLVLTFYGIPLEPGRSRVITAFFTNAKVPPLMQKLTRAFEWVFHLGQNQVLDSDAMLLHVQERLLHDGRDPNWRSAFFMPAGSDTGIIKFRTWFQDCAGGDVPWPGSSTSGSTSTRLGPIKPRSQVMDRLHQHVEGCRACSSALQAVQRLQVAALVLAGAAAAVAIATVTAAAVTAAPAAAAGGGVAAQGGVSALLAAIPGWQAGVAAGLAVALLVAHQLLEQLRQRFIFRDYVHAAIP